MEENTQLPVEMLEEIEQNGERYADKYLNGVVNTREHAHLTEAWASGATAYATKLHQANETIKVLTYDNNRLKGEVEGLKSAVDELRTKYDNILATESGHESKTENVWQSGYAAGHEAGYERGKREAQPGARWVKADTKPKHNVGVLVFIPGEDNHITSGMWDVSNEWVLLDEYRTPEEEVTHWMPLPEFPEGYTWNEIPDDLVDALKKVAKEELGKLTQSRADFIREANNRDLDESAAAREEDWISVDERLPEEGGRYWCYMRDINDLGASYFQWNCAYNANEKTIL